MISKFDYTYNANGTLASWQEQTDSNTPTIWNYQYDGADQLLSATDTNTSTSAVLSQYVYGYDLAGNRTSEQIGVGVTSTGFNNLNQSTGASGGGPLQFSGTVSKPVQVTVAGNTATYGNYYSTNFSGLATVTAGTNTVPVIATDVDGNVATNDYQVVVPSASSTTPSYDSAGNLTNNGNGQTYTWDAKNELVKITQGSNTYQFAYDGLGRRVSETDNGTLTKQWVWIGSTMAEERNASDSVTKRFFPQGEQISGTSYYYTRDHLNSVRELMAGDGATIEARYDYDPYGRVNTITGTIPSDFQYAGMYEHAASGLNLTWFRAYDPNTARWLSRDPIGTRGGINLYGYVGNDPIRWTDPLGLYTPGRGAPGSPVNQSPPMQSPFPDPTPFDSTSLGQFSLFNLINGNLGNYLEESLGLGGAKLAALQGAKKVCPAVAGPVEEAAPGAAALITGVATAADAAGMGLNAAANNAVANTPPNDPTYSQGVDMGGGVYFQEDPWTTVNNQ